EENLREMGRSLADLPIVIQYNKRDLPDAMTIEDLEKQVNVHAFPHFEAVAPSGQGVFPTLKALAAMVLEAVNRGGIGATRTAKPVGAPATNGTPAPAAAAAASVAPLPSAAPKPAGKPLFPDPASPSLAPATGRPVQ